jgi:4-methyl-5(b-hydroxyethyl)-thiazole monophosphate biosynthesis
MSKVTVFIADGTEEVECLTIVDLLRRAGIDVRLVSIMESQTVVSSHKVTIVADGQFDTEDYSDSDMLFIPGGMPGVTNMLAHQGLKDLIKKFYAEGKRLGAVCAGPSVLGQAGVLEGKKATCFPGWEDKLNCGEYTGALVETDGPVITGRGLGACIEEGLEIISILKDDETAADIKRRIQHPDTI